MLSKVVSRLMCVVLLLGVLSLLANVRQARTDEPIVLRARVDLKPDILSLRCPRNLIACYIELPQGYRPSSIVASSIRLNRTFSPLRGFTIGDYDGDGVPDMQVMFERAPILRRILASANATQIVEQRAVVAALVATGYLIDGTAFQGTDLMRVLVPPLRGVQ